MKAFGKTLLVLSAFQLLTMYCHAQIVYNWYPVSSGTTNTLNYTNVNWIAGANGTLRYSSNSGVNWNVISSPVTEDLNWIASFGSTAIAVGSGGRIIKTTTAGSVWEILSSGTTANLNSVSRNSVSQF